MDGWIIAPGGAVILAIVIIVKIISMQQRRINDHAERIAHIEGEIHARQGETED